MNRIKTWENLFPQLPVLVLGTKVYYSYETRDKTGKNYWAPENFNYRNKDEWMWIEHQTAGISCNHPSIIGTIISLEKNIQKKVEKICDKWYDSSAGAFGKPSLEIVNEYRKDLNELLNVDCNNSYTYFQEAFYPIDLEYIEILTNGKIKENDLENLVILDENRPVLQPTKLSILLRWNLFILAENSD